MMPPFWTIAPGNPLLQELAELFVKGVMAELRNINLNYELHTFRFGERNELHLSFHTVFNGEVQVVQHKIDNLDRMTRDAIGQLARVTAIMIAQTFGERLFLSPIGDSNE